MKKNKFPQIILYMILIVYTVITVYPFVWALFAAFKPYSEIVGGGLSILPQNPTLENFHFIFTEDPLFMRWLKNSIIIACSVTFINVIFNSMCGYALARLNFPGRKPLFLIVIVTIMIPGQILLIPNFLILRDMGLLDTHAALIIPSAINFAYIFMMRQFFISFPREMEEAAQIDGLSRPMIFFKIVFPMARAAVGTQAIFVFLGSWNDFMRPLLYVSSPENFTLTLGLQTFQSTYATQWNFVMAAAIVTIAPILVLYILLNKYFMKGMRIGGDK